jgi:uncharacterized surface protein with fasciclin (FAS1) repeats
MPSLSVGLRLAGFALASLAFTASPVFAAPRTAQHDIRLAVAGHAPVVAGSVLDAAAAAGNCTIFLAAVKAADLTQTLAGPGPFTVFVPTDAAFAKLPAEELADLLKPENKARLRTLLGYHVIPAELQLHDEATGDVAFGSAAAMAGGDLHFSAIDGTTAVDGLRVTKRDIKATNGYIDLIDTVMLPTILTAQR